MLNLYPAAERDISGIDCSIFDIKNCCGPDSTSAPFQNIYIEVYFYQNYFVHYWTKHFEKRIKNIIHHRLFWKQRANVEIELLLQYSTIGSAKVCHKNTIKHIPWFAVSQKTKISDIRSRQWSILNKRKHLIHLWNQSLFHLINLWILDFILFIHRDKTLKYIQYFI